MCPPSHPTREDTKTLRWAGRGDMQTTDPHSQNETLTNNMNGLATSSSLDARQGAQLPTTPRRLVEARSPTTVDLQPAPRA